MRVGSLLSGASGRRTLGTLTMLAPIMVLFVLAYLLPLGSLVAESFQRGGSFSFENHTQLLGSKAFTVILWRTLEISAVVTAICLLVAYPVAYVLTRVPARWAAGLLLLVSIPYITSILIRSYAWVVLLASNGVINKLLLGSGIIETPLRLAFSETGTYIGMVHVQLPLMIFPLYAAMHRIDRTTVAAARSLGSTPASAFWHIFFPLSLSGVASGCTLVFLSCLGFYVTPALLGAPGQYMLAQGITVRVMTLSDFAGASAQATLLLVFVVIVFVLLRKRFATGLGIGEEVRGKRSIANSGLRDWPRFAETVAEKLHRAAYLIGAALSTIGWPLVVATTIAAFLYLVLPLLIIFPLAFSDSPYLTFPPPGYSLRWFMKFFANTRWLEGTAFSFGTAGVGALVSLLFAVPAAFAIARRPVAGRLTLYLVLISPLIVPHVIVALAMYFSLAQARLVGTFEAFVIAYALCGTPYVFILFVSGVMRFDRSLEMAAANLGATPSTVLRTVTFPLLLPTLASALLFSFIMGFDDVIFGLFLAGPGATPLPIRMWEDIRHEISPQVAVVAILLFAAMAVAYAAYLLLSRLSLRGSQAPAFSRRSHRARSPSHHSLGLRNR
jgi:putative spermidine/putrescine transport system permease protein